MYKAGVITRTNATFDVLNTEGGGTSVGYGTSYHFTCKGRSRWPRGLRRGSAVTRCLGLRVRIPPGARMSISCEGFGFFLEVSASGRSLVHRRPTECGVSECDREASIKRRPWPTRGAFASWRGGLNSWKLPSARHCSKFTVSPCLDGDIVLRPSYKVEYTW